MENVRVLWTNTLKTAIKTLKGSLLLRMLSFILVAGLNFYGWTIYEDYSAQQSINSGSIGFTESENGQKNKAAGKGKSSKDVPGLALAKSIKQLNDPFDATRLGTANKPTGASANAANRSNNKGLGGANKNSMAQFNTKGQNLVDTNSVNGSYGNGSSGASQRNTELKGIVHSVNGDGAIIEINGKQQTLLLGETLGTVTLLALGESSATLSINEEEHFLSMKG